jgi:putative aldouronate transport system permease protein
MVTQPRAVGAPSAVRRRSFASILATRWPLYVMLIPGLIMLALFHYYPMYGVVIAFQRFNPGLGFTRSPWVGLRNFQQLFSNYDFFQVFYNTLVIAVSKLISVQFFAVVLAIMLNEIRSVTYRRVMQSLVYLPHFLSWVVLSGILVDILGETGLVNNLLRALGLAEPIIFLGSNLWFRPTLVITNLWQQVGWATIIYLAALLGIDPQLHEAAAIDGASRWQRMVHVTLPGLASTVVLISCLNLGNVLQAGFEQVLNLYNPAVYRTGDILDTYVYREGIVSARYSLASAVGLVKSLLGLALIVTAYKLADKYSGYRIF